MSSITNVNNNASVVNVGRTTPVSPGAQPASKSIPVVIATDQTAIPVEEQNKVQSEVALSLLGIPRAEVALGIFADVNTYDVNPSEWSSSPQYHITGHGIQHLPTEAGALVEAPRNKTAVLTSKRFFRYQPGRVSAATFGVKSTVGQKTFSQNPSIRKFGIYDNFDGYFWETRDDCQEDNFSVVRRSQSLTKAPNSPTGIVGQSLKGGVPAGTIGRTQFDDYRIIGNGASEAIVPSTLLVKDRELIINNRFAIIDGVVNGLDTGTFYADLAAAIGGSETAASVKEKCARDLDYWVDFYLLDMEHGGTNHTKINITNYATAILPAIATYEKPTHIALGTALTGYSGLSSAGVTKLTTLTGLTNTAFNRNNGQSVLVPSISDSDYGNRSKIDTIFATKSHYWAYHVTARNGDTTAGSFVIGITYKISSLGNTNWNAIGATGTPAVGDRFTATGAGSGTGTADSAATYTVPSGYPYTVEELKYKCQRDVGYIVGGYGNDIAGGGDGETKYNMSMYFKGGRPASASAGFGMSIYSQNTGGNPVQAEIDRHTHLRDTILADFTSYFGYSSSSSQYLKLNALATRAINNFSIEDTQQMDVGDRGFAGNLVAMRDGIILTHSAVYDPKLLKDIEQIVTVVDTDNQFKLTKGVVQFKGHVKVKTWANVSSVTTIGTIEPGKVYKVVNVIGPKGNEFTLEDEDGTAQTFTVAQATAAGTIYLETVVPFIFPKKGTTLAIGSTKLAQDLTGTNTYAPTVSVGYHGYDPVNYRDAHNIAADGSTDTFPGGMVFPYMYASDNNLNSTDASASIRVGYVNTALDISTADGLNTVCDQIDYVNFDPNFVTWVRFNVKPEFWGVYDYRVPRSRYSHDTLDGRTAVTNPPAKQRVYSDVATGENGTARPGQGYTIDGTPQLTSSLYNFDFTKVTMLKIEFSWYGAVGALFLAYVPVENGEARWVRVHHLRASNQYKNASLGNATLPITYTTYGGGDAASLGDGEDANFVDRGYGSQSHSIVKYGASYYIDGGDRGTVRLYSHNNELTQDAYGKAWTIANGNYNSSDNSINITSSSLSGNANTSVDPRFFMGARFKSANRTDQNIKVVWADATKVYLDGVPTGTPTNMSLLVDRANATYNLETKKIILSTQQSNAVRNRVQVYPTKLSSSNLSTGAAATPVRMRFKKTPVFQTDTVFTGTFTLDAPYTLTALNEPLSTVGVTESGGAGTYIDNNESVFGWFQALVDADEVTVFGRLYKESDEYYFELLESFNGVIQLKADPFLPDLRFEADGDDVAQTTVTKVTSEKEGLSSIKIANDTVVPIPNTGINVATIYLQPGTEQLDLSPYFDYNKEYLSFPLTDQADSLYFAIDSDNTSGVQPIQVSLGCTWEEQ